MTNVERIRSILDKKWGVVPENIEIISPSQDMARQQADQMIKLLEEVYGQHAIANNADSIVDSIESGQTQCFFVQLNDETCGVTALIDLGDAVELGRGVSTERGNGIGSLLMLEAAQHHFLTNPHKPLIAEVRLAAEFDGIPGSAATKIICFRDIGLLPHAIIPAFSHGHPSRTEMFAFSTIQAQQESEKLFLPRSIGKEWETAIGLLSAPLFSGLVETIEPFQRHSTWTSTNVEPFTIIEESNRGIPIADALSITEGDRFRMFSVEAREGNTGAIEELTQLGAIPMGVDRNTGTNNHPMLLLGLLNDSTLAPANLQSLPLPEEIAWVMQKIDFHFRQ